MNLAGAAVAPVRSVDHVVMPVPSLVQSRRLFEGLGFLVAPDAQHPFGTGNACVFFADGRYLEPLSVASQSAYDSALASGSIFVRRDQAFRSAHPDPSFSAIAFASVGADVDLARLDAADLSDGAVFEFSRPFSLPSGSQGRAVFRLAFVAAGAGNPSFFFCQPTGDAPPDRSPLTTHPNGATGLQRIVVSCCDINAFSDLLHSVRGGTEGFELIHAKDGRGRHDNGLSGAWIDGIVLCVPDVGRVAAHAAAASIPLERRGVALVVRLKGDADAFIAFEEAS